jgi:tRNA A-37 threonylcarbamoyl transferase component Bud32/CheY-like chemotaxis protein
VKVIIVDDSKEFMTLARRLLAQALPHIEVTEYDPEQQGPPGRDFDWSLYDVVFLDYALGPHETAFDWLVRYRSAPGFPPTVLMTAAGDEYVAAQAIKLGASDFLRKADVSPARLGALVQQLVAERRATHPQFALTVNDKLEQDARILDSVRRPEDPPDGKPIGYRFVRLIGQGATSRVYLAERRSDRATLVLKVIDIASVKEPAAVKRFVREASLISRVDSPYVVRFFDHGFTDTYGFIAMEFFTRGDLKHRIEHGVTVDDALNYLLHIAHGLEAIHAHGIVHRDLKPGNIMFRSDDSLALADFGISKRLDETSELTRQGSVLGTPNYISPEQALGHPVDHRVDLYSAGIILYEMLTGRKPFRADTAPALVYQHVHAAIPSLTAPLRRFQPMLNRLLAKVPEERYGSASELIAELQAATT